MREILFKAKAKNWRERPKEWWWVEGYYAKMGKDDLVRNYIIQNYALAGLSEDPEMNMCFNDVEIDPETVCQYIGMRDKNGNRIWENDICEMVYDGRVNIYVIVWDAEEVDFKGTNGKEKYGSNFEYLGCCEEIVKIGNIFDNPELLEENNYEH